MKTSAEAVHQSDDTSEAIVFIHDHKVVREIDSKPVITRKREQLLLELHESSTGRTRSSPEL